MTMVADKHLPKGRNFLIWSAIGAVVCTIAILGMSSLNGQGLSGTIFRSPTVTAQVGLALVLAASFVGMVMRKAPVTRPAIARFLAGNVAAIALFMVLSWGFSTLAATAVPGTIGASEKAALATGAVFFVLGVLTMGVCASIRFMAADKAEDLRLQRRELIYAAATMVAWGTALVLLALSGPVGIVRPMVALPVALALYATGGVLGFAQWRAMDELKRLLSQESGNWTFYLLTVVGGGWAILAHLGFVAGPVPLDWLTMFSALMLVASFIAIGRRGLLVQPH
ncbi:hypothetical protein [Niveispirillum sp. KHB5.9]|uniref:hypothetical protein n=1 Tax=Niveispirillum sp. KHB5.9 TaxID=3400269 RepID=UPI003A8B6959